MKLGTLFSMKFRVLKPIPVDISRNEEGMVIAEWGAISEYGVGENVSEALKDLTDSVKDLYGELKGKRIGADLNRVLSVMERYFQQVR